MMEDKNIICPNCEKEFDKGFDFCPHCGQRNKKLELQLKYFFNDFLSSSFNLDSKIIRTLRLLIFYPGKLTKAFLAGKRASYVPPVRLYLIISLVYFTLLSFVGTDIAKIADNENEDLQEDTTVVQTNENINDSLVSEVVDSTSTQRSMLFGDENKDVVLTINNLDQLDQLIGNEGDSVSGQGIGEKSKWGKFAQERLRKFGTKEGRKTFDELLRKYISIGMFVLMPITALIFYLLFYRRTYYIQHLVFVLHLQSMMFILFICFNLLGLIGDYGFVDLLFMASFLFVLLIWIKKFYKVRWGKTIWKSILFLLMFGLSFGTFFIVVALVSAWNF